VIRRIALGFGATVLVFALTIGTLTAAWLAGLKVPLASGATYMQIQKLAGADAAGSPTGMFFIALIGSDARAGVSGSRGDALHLVGVNPATNTATMLNIPRDTCWRGDKINAAHAQGGPRGMADALGDVVGVPVTYAVSVDFAGFEGLVDGWGGLQINVPFPMNDRYSGAVFSPGDQRLSGTQALAFSRNRHDFTTSDLQRTDNQGLLLLAALRQIQSEGKSAWGEFKAAALLGRHAQLDGLGLTEVYRLGRLAERLDPGAVRSVTIPTGGGGCLGLGGGAQALFADFADDATLQSH
jgi:polyisoprenyl-teichoic acid--peptidoglycan teichoic acid transferase